MRTQRFKEIGRPVEVPASDESTPPVIVAGIDQPELSLLTEIIVAAGVDAGLQVHDAESREQADKEPTRNPSRLAACFQDSCLKRRSLNATNHHDACLPILWSETELQEARAIVSSVNGPRAWGWGHPDTCLFLASWIRLLPGARLIVSFRDPLSTLADFLRRAESRFVDDPISGLEWWCVRARATLDALEKETPHDCIVLEADAIRADAPAVCQALRGIGIEVSPSRIEHLTRGKTWTPAGLSTNYRNLLHAACPEAVTLHREFIKRATVSTSGRVTRPAESHDSASGIERVAGAFAENSSRVTVNSLLIAALTLHAPDVAKAMESRNRPSGIAKHGGGTEEGKEDYAVQPGQSGWGSSIGDGGSEALLAARLDSTQQLLEETRRRLARTEAEADHAVDHVRALTASYESVVRERDEAIRHWQKYRRRWPPYIVAAGARRSGRALRSFLERRMTPWARQFGRGARMIVLNTGMPESGSIADATGAAVAAQTIAAERIVWPGRSDALTDDANLIRNWWAPDLPTMTRGYDLTVVIHPEYYGPGPFWLPQFLELIRAAFASDQSLDAIAFRGADGEPTIDTINHLYETDAATIGTWNEQTVAAAFRAPMLRDAFGAANRGEQRNLVPTLQHLVNERRKVLVAPRTFPLDATIASKSRKRIGRDLPPAVEIRDQSAPVRALYVTQWIECGGADKGIIDLVTQADPIAVRFSVMTTAAANHTWARHLDGHVEELIHLGDHLPLPPDRRFPAFLTEYVRRRGIELVHIMHSFQGYDAVPLLKRKCPDVRIIDQCHILEKPDFAGGGHPVYATTRYQRFFDHRTVTSEWLRRHLIRNYGVPERDISVIYTCVDAHEEFNPDRYKPGEFREDFDIPHGVPVVVFLGRFHEQKRPDLFARVAAAVSERRPDLGIHFVMIGDGELRPQVEAIRRRMIDPTRLVLAGELDHSGPVLRDADLLLMLSEREGLAYVSYEAMAMGVPQIFSDVNAQSELVTPDVGALLDPSDPDRLVDGAAKETIRLIEDRSAHERMSRAARQRILQHFTIDRMVDAYQGLYRRLVGRSGARAKPQAGAERIGS